MALGGNVLRQHVVEFIRGVGVVTDGVVDATSLNGPWTWQVPDGVAELTLDGCGAGGGGAGGQNTGAARGGGGGGGSGLSLNGLRLPVIPRSILNISVGAGGLGSLPGAAGGWHTAPQGGVTTITGLTRSPFAAANMNQLDAGGISMPAGEGGSRSNTQGNGGSGGMSATGGLGNGAGGGEGVSQASPTPGVMGSEANSAGLINLWGCAVYAHGGSGAGAGSTNPAVAGSSGQNFRGSGGRALNASWSFRGGDTQGTGNTDGSISYGGGGGGGPSPYGVPGDVPNGNQSAVPGQGFGYGGNGGGGNAAGAPGGDGYVRFTYWSMD